MISRVLFSLILGTVALQAQVWTQQSPSVRPSPRHRAPMAYDSIRNEFVLFGGDTFGHTRDNPPAVWNNETWTYNGTVWTRKNPALNPPALGVPSLVFDPIRGVTVLLGEGQIWLWDGVNWSFAGNIIGFGGGVPTWPPVAAWDPVRGGVRVSVFATIGSPLEGLTLWGWFWDGTTGRVEDTGNVSFIHSAFAYDEVRRQFVSFGGWVDGRARSRTTLDGGNGWFQVNPPASPSARWGHRMVWDPASQSVLLYGGSEGSDELWSWNGTTWTQIVAANAPPARSERSFAINPATNLMVVFGGRDSGGTLNDETWHLRSLQAPANITATNAPGQCGAFVSYPPPQHSGQAAVNCSPASGGFFAVGSTAVTCTSATNATVSFGVTVRDIEAPRVTPPAAQMAPMPAPAVLTYAATGSDNCPGVQVSANPASGSTFPAGSHTVTFTATDAAGNSATGSTTFSVPARYTITSNPPGLPLVIDGQPASSLAPATGCPGPHTPSAV